MNMCFLYLGFQVIILLNLAWMLHDKSKALACVSVVYGHQCFRTPREGHGTEVWRSCLSRRVGKWQPAEHMGQPKVYNGNCHRALDKPKK